MPNANSQSLTRARNWGWRGGFEKGGTPVQQQKSNDRSHFFLFFVLMDRTRESGRRGGRRRRCAVTEITRGAVVRCERGSEAKGREANGRKKKAEAEEVVWIDVMWGEGGERGDKATTEPARG